MRPAGIIQSEQERVFLRVTGAFDSERDIETVNIVSGDRIFRLGDIATVRRGFVDPPQPMFRVNGKPAIGLAIAMRDSGDILALGENVRKEMADIKANLPVGIETDAGRRPGGHRGCRDQRLHDVAVAGDRHHSASCSFVSLGVRPGAVVALAIPLTLAIVFAMMDVAHIDLHRISLGALIIALDVAGRRRDDDGGRDDPPARCGRHQGRGGDLRLPDAGGADADRHAGDDRRASCRSALRKSSAGEYTFSIFSVVAISLIVSVAGGGDLRAAASARRS